MELESDRMRNLVLTEEEFAKEIKVVMEERRLRTDDQARALVHEKMMATSYQSHPYRHPVIGWMNDLENMTFLDAKAWYERWYAPNNAVLVVVGDVNPREVFALGAKVLWTDQARGSCCPWISASPRSSRQQVGHQAAYGESAGTAAISGDGISCPGIAQSRVPIGNLTRWRCWQGCWMATSRPASTRSWCASSALRVRQAQATIRPARGPGMFYLDGTPSEGKTVADLETALRGEVEKLVREGVTEEELARVKAQVVAAHVFQLDSMFFQAMQIGQLESIGLSYRDVDTIFEKLQAVTAEQVRDVAKKYLKDDVLTVAVLDPQPLEQKAPSAPPAGIAALRPWKHAELFPFLSRIPTVFYESRNACDALHVFPVVKLLSAMGLRYAADPALADACRCPGIFHRKP